MMGDPKDRDDAVKALAALRQRQSHGMSLKRAVRKGLVRIVLSDAPLYRDRLATVES